VYLRTFGYVLAAGATCLLIGYPIAYFVARYGGRRKGLFLALLIMPFWISYLMRMYAWQSLLERDGYVNDMLRFFQVMQEPFGWLEGHGITVVIGLVYGYLPYLILPLYGQLDRIDQSQLEAGRDLARVRGRRSSGHAPALEAGDPGRSHHHHASDVRRLLHEQPAVPVAPDDDDRQPDRHHLRHARSARRACSS
jgi:hypothetical protein